MKKQTGFTLVELLIVVILIAGVGSWIWNATKLASCDFDAGYKCELIHGAGLVVPPISIVTAWFGDDGA